MAEEEITYKRMGDITEGDILIGSENAQIPVNHAYEAHTPERMFRLRFSNGEIIEASGNHLWYTVSSLDRQLHSQRLKEAKEHLLPALGEKKIAWLRHNADYEAENSPEVDLSFLFDVLNVDDTTPGAANQMIRIAESIGPVAHRYEYVYDENDEQLKETGDRRKRIYSLKLFCEQTLALIAEATGKKHRTSHQLLKGKVRTTEEIVDTWDLKHDFPSTGGRSFFGGFGK